VKSVYERHTKNENGPVYKDIWKAKILEKVKIFMWLLAPKAILTKDNMVRRNWQGNPSCYFCESIETVDHLLLSCPVVKVVWGVVALCFKQKIDQIPLSSLIIGPGRLCQVARQFICLV
jgi:hypothetical protein